MVSRHIGLVFETFGTYPRRPDDPEDWEAEYEPEETVCGLEAALARLGHRAVRLGSPRDLLRAIGADALPPLDAALSIAEGRDTRNREGWAPSLLEMAGVPALGSDALTLGLCLDKAWTRRVVAAAGVPVAPGCSAASGAELDAGALPAPFPLFVKPGWEGTAKGIREHSKVDSPGALRAEVDRVVSAYRQPALVEAFVPGPEYTVTVTGHRPPRTWLVLQRALERGSGIGLHALEGPGRPSRELEPVTPGHLDAALEAELQALALAAFDALECRDFARADFRLDAGGRPVFLEINPLPTFAPDGSFGILAELAGRALEDVLAEVLADSIERVLGPTVANRGEQP
jgi:D-alanine-D-alanine ligase